MSNSLWHHSLQHARLPYPSPTPGACSNSCPLSWWCHPTILSNVVPFSSCLQSFLASGSFLVSQLFAWGGQSIGASAQKCIENTNTKTDQSSWQEKQQHNFFKLKLPRLATCAQSLSRVQLFVTPQTIARQAPLSTGILQARILEWVVMPFSRGSSQPRDQTQVSHLLGRSLLSEIPGKVQHLL